MSTDPPAPPAPAAPAPDRSRDLQALLDATVDAIVIIDHRGNIEIFNRSAERLFGYRSDEIIGQNISILMTREDSGSHDDYMKRYRNTGVPHIIGIGREVAARRKDGSNFPAFLSVGRIAGSDPPRFVGFLHDITLRRESMAAIRRERDRANTYLEVAQVILLALSVDGRVQLVNRRGCETLGRREIDLLGQDWFNTALPENEREAARSTLRKLYEPGAQSEAYCEYSVINAEGERRLVAWRCIALRAANGEPQGFLCSGDDITDRRRAEEAALASQQRMTHVSRLATMGEMAAGIAHELNQPLTAIANFASAAQRLAAATMAEDDDVRLALTSISQQALRAGEIIRRLRSMVQNRETRTEPADINALVGEVLALSQSDARLHDVQIHLNLAAGLPPVPVDSIQIQQILLNLVRNAIEAIDEFGSERRDVNISTERDADAVLISVRDSGPGVPEALRSRMFDPFCTTKEAGTGLGLAISRSIAEAHRGKLQYLHEPDCGACFTLRLPAAVEVEVNQNEGST